MLSPLSPLESLDATMLNKTVRTNGVGTVRMTSGDKTASLVLETRVATKAGENNIPLTSSSCLFLLSLAVGLDDGFARRQVMDGQSAQTALVRRRGVEW